MNKKQFNSSIETNLKAFQVLNEFTHSLLTSDKEVKNDFEMKVKELIEQLGYEVVYNKLTQESTESKMDIAGRVYDELYKKSTRRCDVIREIMKVCDMSKDGASTYFQNIRKKRGHCQNSK